MNSGEFISAVLRQIFVDQTYWSVMVPRCELMTDKLEIDVRKGRVRASGRRALSLPTILGVSFLLVPILAIANGARGLWAFAKWLLGLDDW
jgi:hypothetical protein